METVIVYYSFMGNNRRLAEALQRRLGCAAYEILPQKQRGSFDLLLDAFFYRRPPIKVVPLQLTGDERVILIGPIWNAHIAAPLRTFMSQVQHQLHDYAFVTLCAGRPGQRAKLLRELERFIGKAPRSLLELAVTDLLPLTQRKGLSASRHRVSQDELAQLEAPISRFLAEIAATELAPALGAATPSAA